MRCMCTRLTAGAAGWMELTAALASLLAWVLHI